MSAQEETLCLLQIAMQRLADVTAQRDAALSREQVYIDKRNNQRWKRK